uniref:Uncharacterized protein n=1 Tax=Parascaris equorum TaxID=6256 RepID=A0A914RI26_PAREQ
MYNWTNVAREIAWTNNRQTCVAKMLSRLLGDCTRSSHLRAFILPSLRQFSRTSSNAARGFGNRYAQQNALTSYEVGEA